MPCILNIKKCVFLSPIGDLELVVCSHGVHSLNQLDENDETFYPDQSICVTVKNGEEIGGEIGSHIHSVQSWLMSYFQQPESIKSIDLPVMCLDSISGETFLNIWMVLAHNIHPGQKISYSDLAVHSGRSKGAARLVGQAMAENPFQIIVPCHRVVPKSGKVGQYSRGKKNKVKEWLLKFEGCEIEEKMKKEKDVL